MLQSPKNRYTVIIVEDDPMVRRINEGFLEKVPDYEHIGSYGSIKHAKEVILQKAPDLLLLDIFFPNEQGVELLKWLRENHIGTDVIFITADNSAHTIEEAKRYGAFDYLLKPFRFERLEEALIKYRQMREKLDATSTFNQKDVDHIMDADETVVIQKKEVSEPITSDHELLSQNKHMNKTYQLIYNYLHDNPQDFFTAKNIGQRLGISRITARRYLDKMEQEDIVYVEPNYGSIGRPQNHYRLKGDIGNDN